MQARLHLGLISGTSMDGIDAVLLDTTDAPRVLAARSTPYDDRLKSRLHALVVNGACTLDELGELNVSVAIAFASAALALLDEAGVDPASVAAIGSHGQTVRHGADRSPPFTLQIGDPNTLAELTGITTIADFRGRDIAAGGQGAPLLPGFHASVFASEKESRAVLNLGGIANLTLLVPGEVVTGFDTGPANCLLDAWYEANVGGRHDADGAFAASGRVDEGLLRLLLDEPYFARPAPKSTGRELFSMAWLVARGGARLSAIAAPDVQATLLELTARSVAEALPGGARRPRRLIACGGGVHNGALMRSLMARLPDSVVESSAAWGLNPDFVEAAGFAWFASRTLAGEPANVPSVTGARGPRRLGGIFPGR